MIKEIFLACLFFVPDLEGYANLSIFDVRLAAYDSEMENLYTVSYNNDFNSVVSVFKDGSLKETFEVTGALDYMDADSGWLVYMVRGHGVGDPYSVIRIRCHMDSFFVDSIKTNILIRQGLYKVNCIESGTEIFHFEGGILTSYWLGAESNKLIETGKKRYLSTGARAQYLSLSCSNRTSEKYVIGRNEKGGETVLYRLGDQLVIDSMVLDKVDSGYWNVNVQEQRVLLTRFDESEAISDVYVADLNLNGIRKVFSSERIVADALVIKQDIAVIISTGLYENYSISGSMSIDLPVFELVNVQFIH